MATDRPPWTFVALSKQDKHSLESILAAGVPITMTEVVGFEFRGWNINAMTEVIRTRKFKKGFYRDAHTGEAWGYNVTVRQGTIDEPWQALPSEQAPKRYYFFGVSDASPQAPHPNALIVDYRRWPKNSKLDPVRYTVDYLVAPDAGNRDLLLGKSYAELPFAKIPLGFFVIERHNPTDFGGPREDR